MKNKHIPIRKCIGCGIQKSKNEFMMIVRPPKKLKDKNLYIKPGMSIKEGRAAYICKKLECIKKAKKSRKIEKSLLCKADAEIYTSLEKVAEKNE